MCVVHLLLWRKEKRDLGKQQSLPQTYLSTCIYLHFSIFSLGYSLLKRRLNIIPFKPQLLHSCSLIFNSSLSHLECLSFFQEESMSSIFLEPLHIWDFIYAFTYKRQFLLFLTYRIFVLQTFPLNTSSLWFHCLSAFNYSLCTAFLRLPSWLVFILFYLFFSGRHWQEIGGQADDKAGAFLICSFPAPVPHLWQLFHLSRNIDYSRKPFFHSFIFLIGK